MVGDGNEDASNPQQPAPASSNQAVGEQPFTFIDVPLSVIVLSNGEKVIRLTDVAALARTLVEYDPQDVLVGAIVATELVRLGEFARNLPTPGGEA